VTTVTKRRGPITEKISLQMSLELFKRVTLSLFSRDRTAWNSLPARCPAVVSQFNHRYHRHT